ncbi:MAG: hypothetical protein ACP5DX_11215 [Paracoccaceae bacterium]|jgi:hypothetical protein
MKQTLVMMAAVPVACLVAGYGAGKFIAPPPSESAAVENAAELHLDAAAEAEGAAPHGAVAGGHGAPKEKGPYIVDLGSMTIPVYKPRSITYIVAEFGITLQDRKSAVHYDMPEHATRLRDAILSFMSRAANGPTLRGVAIDTDTLSQAIHAELVQSHPEIQEVLFLSFFKKDVPRS